MASKHGDVEVRFSVLAAVTDGDGCRTEIDIFIQGKLSKVIPRVQASHYLLRGELLTQEQVFRAWVDRYHRSHGKRTNALSLFKQTWRVTDMRAVKAVKEVSSGTLAQARKGNAVTRWAR